MIEVRTDPVESAKVIDRGKYLLAFNYYSI